MPGYCYFCESNQKVVVVHHDMNTVLKTWGEVCYTNQISLGETDPAEPVRKLITPPNIITSNSNSELKSLGFTKLVKRDKGVYENVTALDHEPRFMLAGDSSTIPDLKKKISD